MIYIQLLESMSLIGLSAYLFSHTKSFTIIMKEKFKLKYKFLVIVFFSILSIIGTYTGVHIGNALANTRPIGAIVAGYIGGPFIGIMVGAIAGMHRYCIGGYTALACALSTLIEGMVGGIFNKINKKLNILNGFFAGIIAELLQIIVILVIARPYSYAVNTVQEIVIPMVLINSIGVAIFINIINDTKERYKKVGAIESQRALSIAKRTSFFLRNGFNKDIANKVSDIIYEMVDVESVFITDNNGIFVCKGENKQALEIENSNYKIKDNVIECIEIKHQKKKYFYYNIPVCTKEYDFKFYIGLGVTSLTRIDNYFKDFCIELSSLLATQIEIYELNQLAKEAYTAKLKALRAQIHPHFLFNALNTIASFCRINPSKARELILNLSNYFRTTLKNAEEFITLQKELDFIESYLSIEKARFGSRLKINIDIEDDLINCKVPTFVLQPIIENSIKHGILMKEQGGQVDIKVIKNNKNLIFKIEDDGVGMSHERLCKVKESWPGIGLSNVNKRLKLLYGGKSSLVIKSNLNEGTQVYFTIPKEVI